MRDADPAIVVRQAFTYALATIEAHEAELGKLDAAAGDGDHGATMVRGLKAAVAALDQDAPNAGALLSQAGMAFSDAAGGASGALYGMFLVTVGQQLGAGPYGSADVAAALGAGQETIARLGKAEPGDKTMLDALNPFVSALAEADDAALAAAWRQALPAAEEGAAATAAMVAKRGRSAKLGERSLGHRDPGAVSMTYLLGATADALDEAGC
jgi:dihydroxyacetone kinase phosphoprotein-dependent L subunit